MQTCIKCKQLTKCEKVLVPIATPNVYKGCSVCVYLCSKCSNFKIKI